MADARPGEAYLAKRQLQSGTAGWVMLAGLGVAYVISGDFAGWNFGLGEGGWGGLAVATAVAATMYACLVLGLAELSSALPTAGGGYTFARRALGTWGGFATGTAILIEYAVAPAAIATFIGGYIQALGLFGITNGWWVYLACYVVFVGIHLIGAGEALRIMFAVTAIAAIALVVYFLALVLSFDASNLTDIPVTQATGASSLLPFGLVGIWSAFPYAIWFFLAVEGVPLAAEEARDPHRDVPRGIVASMAILLVFAVLGLLLGPGGAGAQALAASDNPLVEALEITYGGSTWISQLVNYVGLLGLIASFFSIIYAYSRQTFALSRAGYLPRALSVTNRHKAPVLALVVPAAVGFVLALSGDGAVLINMAVFGATISYVLMMVSHIVLRVREPDLERPYRTPGGILTTGVALVLATAAVVATFIVDIRAAMLTLLAYGALLLYFALYSRHHLVAAAPEEEFAALREAEAELGLMARHASVGGHRFDFPDLRTLLAKASPLRSGDVLAGLAADSAAERVAAQIALADVPLAAFLQELVIPYEDDDVTRLIVDGHDAAAFAPVAAMTVGELRDWLLSDAADAPALTALAPGLTPEMVAAVSKLMRNQDLIAVARRCRVVTAFRSTIGLPGRLASRLQPNHPTDDPAGVLISTLDGLLFGCGDAVIGINPATDSPRAVTELLSVLDAVRERYAIPTQSCVLSHITTTIDVIEHGAPVDLVFQSIAGTQAANEGFGVSLELLSQASEAAHTLSRGTVGDNVMYFETGQGSALSAGAHHGVDQQTVETRAYAVARHFRPLLVNTVVGFIGPEYLYDGKQILRAGLEDHCCGKLLGLPMGVDVCYTNHAEADQDDMDTLLTVLGVAGCSFVIAVPGSDDVMLGYQSLSFHDLLYARRALNLRPAPEFEAWLEGIGLLEGDGRVRDIAPDKSVLAGLAARAGAPELSP